MQKLYKTKGLNAIFSVFADHSPAQSDQMSSKSSLSSLSTASVKTAIKKGARALGRPFKKAKTRLSARSASSTSTTIDPEIASDNDPVIATDIEKASGPDDSDIEIVEVDPEKELSMSIEYLCSISNYYLTATLRRQS